MPKRYADPTSRLSQLIVGLIRRETVAMRQPTTVMIVTAVDTTTPGRTFVRARRVSDPADNGYNYPVLNNPSVSVGQRVLAMNIPEGPVIVGTL